MRPDGPRIERALDELTSVEAPPGASLEEVSVLGCDDGAELAAEGHARMRWDRPDLQTAEAQNAELERLDAWYRERWAELGWSPEKSVDGHDVRAGVDGVTELGFDIVAVRASGGACG